jgi:cell wall-associated NlpC family hydrolase
MDADVIDKGHYSQPGYGQLVFFTRDSDRYPAHVGLSLGNGNIAHLWARFRWDPGIADWVTTQVGVEVTTIQVIESRMINDLGYSYVTVSYGDSPW